MADVKKTYGTNKMLENIAWKKVFGSTPQSFVDFVAKTLDKICTDKPAYEEHKK